ncbi:hypothetical protein H9P43_001896 [Blastocladiella emersonii ATCC 22665]|nr:hypothetical protein H9P43_001896 [Blastocladiella emersonii ATCC 22665]
MGHGLIQINSTFRYSIHALEQDTTKTTGLARRHVLLRETATSPNSNSEHFCLNKDPGFPPSAPRRKRLQNRDPAELSLIGGTSFHSSALEMTQLVRRQIASTANLRIVYVAAALYLRSNLIADPYRIIITVAGQYTATAPMWVAESTTGVNAWRLLIEFCEWRQSQASDPANAGSFLASNDLGHLLSGRNLTVMGSQDTLEGYGYYGGMCTANSCAVVHAPRVVDLAYQGTMMAHEMGHSFGAGHDSVQDDCPEHGFIMQESTCTSSGALPTQFSSCSDTAITSFLASVDTRCLDNVPALCGNWIVDPGEQCDSGNPLTGSACCTARCRLRTGAVCADKNGKCCRNCQFAAAGTICRQRATDAVQQQCDVVDTCTGNSFVCTVRKVANGASCFLNSTTNSSTGTCNRGFCQSRASVCSSYGYGYSPSGQCVNLSITSSLVAFAPDYTSCPHASGSLIIITLINSDSNGYDYFNAVSNLHADSDPHADSDQSLVYSAIEFLHVVQHDHVLDHADYNDRKLNNFANRHGALVDGSSGFLAVC